MFDLVFVYFFRFMFKKLHLFALIFFFTFNNFLQFLVFYIF